MAYLDACRIASEIIVVDDGSNDATAAVVSERCVRDSRIHLVRFEHNRGKGAAVRAGVSQSTGERVLFMEKGRVQFSGRGSDLLRRKDLLRSVFLGAGRTGRSSRGA